MSVVCFLLITFFRYLYRLKELPPALKTEMFEGLLPYAELARFNKKVQVYYAVKMGQIRSTIGICRRQP